MPTLNVDIDWQFECPILACLVRMIWVQDQHAQAQHWLMKLRLSLSMHEPMLSLSLSMHESMLSLTLSMHEPMLSLSMLVLDPNHPDLAC